MNQNSGLLKRALNTGFAKRYVGDKAFYMAVLALIVPIVIQNSISNFVNLLDNLMVGGVNENQMNGVTIANQMVFVFNLCIFGGMAGSAIFGAQFFGAHDIMGVRHSFRFAIAVSLILGAIGTIVIGIFREPLVSLYINNVESEADAAEILSAGTGYLLIMLAGLIPFAITQAYAGVLRVTGETKLPMYASVAGVLVNLVCNYVLIFGHLGFPPMMARGAAIATVISRFVEMGIVVAGAHIRQVKRGMYEFLKGAYRHFLIPMALIKRIILKGSPLFINEALWSLGMATLTQQYSMRGDTVVTALGVTSAITNLFNVFFLSMGTAASVMVGQALGANDTNLAKENARRVIFFQICLCVTIGILLLAFSPVLPHLYTKVSAEARSLSTKFMIICALMMPVSGFAHCTYFILRSGGRTIITFLFDSAFTWLLPVPLAYLLVTYTDWNIVGIYIACHSVDFVKDAIGYALVKKGVWIRNFVS